MAVTPIMIDLNKKHVVIVGGGQVAERRMNILLESGASITVISPEIKKGIRERWGEGKLTWKKKHVEASDLQNAFMIIVATNDPYTNQSVIQAAPPNSLINAATEANSGNVEFPASFTRGKLAISVSTNGASPQLTAKIKNELRNIFHENYESYVDFLYESRQLIKQSVLDKSHQKLLLKELLSNGFLDKQKQVIALTWFRKLAAKTEIE